MKRTLIYIIGAGRSGTTILDIVLGNNNDAISLGEINRFYKRNGITPQRDKDNKVYLFWKKIKDEFEEKLNSSTIKYNEFEKVNSKNEYHSAFFKSLLKLNSKKYYSTLDCLYDSIIENTKESILIESSKYPVRALNISKLKRKDIEIKYIYLKKDPVKVINSFNKKDLEQPPKGFLTANIYYFIVNCLSYFVIQILKFNKHKTSELKYEDFINNPVESIQNLSRDLDENFNSSKNILKNKEPLKTGFLFDGNRIRLKESIYLQTKNNSSLNKNLKYYFTRIFNYLIYKK